MQIVNPKTERTNFLGASGYRRPGMARGPVAMLGMATWRSLGRLGRVRTHSITYTVSSTSNLFPKYTKSLYAPVRPVRDQAWHGCGRVPTGGPRAHPGDLGAWAERRWLVTFAHRFKHRRRPGGGGNTFWDPFLNPHPKHCANTVGILSIGSHMQNGRHGSRAAWCVCDSPPDLRLLGEAHFG